jgi:hypothetical protein
MRLRYWLIVIIVALTISSSVSCNEERSTNTEETYGEERKVEKLTHILKEAVTTGDAPAVDVKPMAFFHSDFIAKHGIVHINEIGEAIVEYPMKKRSTVSVTPYGEHAGFIYIKNQEEGKGFTIACLNDPALEGPKCEGLEVRYVIY